MQNASNIYRLKKANLKDACQIWMWSLSANNEGQISRVNLQISEFYPHIQFKEQKNEQLQTFGINLFHFINGYKIGQIIVENLSQRFNSFAQQADIIKEQIHQLILEQYNQQINDAQENKIKDIFQENKNIFQQNYAKLVQLQIQILDVNRQKYINDLLHYIQEIQNQIDAIGLQAKNANHLSMIEIFNNYYIGERFDKQTIIEERRRRLIRKNFRENFRDKIKSRYFQVQLDKYKEKKLKEQKEEEEKRELQQVIQEHQYQQDLAEQILQEQGQIQLEIKQQEEEPDMDLIEEDLSEKVIKRNKQVQQ